VCYYTQSFNTNRIPNMIFVFQVLNLLLKQNPGFFPDFPWLKHFKVGVLSLPKQVKPTNKTPPNTSNLDLLPASTA